MQPVAATTSVVEPPKALSPQLHTPPVGPESEDNIVITPRPKIPPLLSIGAKKAFENHDFDILSIDDSDRECETSEVDLEFRQGKYRVTVLSRPT